MKEKLTKGEEDLLAKTRGIVRQNEPPRPITVHYLVRGIGPLPLCLRVNRKIVGRYSKGGGDVHCERETELEAVFRSMKYRLNFLGLSFEEMDWIERKMTKYGVEMNFYRLKGLIRKSDKEKVVGPKVTIQIPG